MLDSYRKRLEKSTEFSTSAPLFYVMLKLRCFFKNPFFVHKKHRYIRSRFGVEIHKERGFY